MNVKEFKEERLAIIKPLLDEFLHLRNSQSWTLSHNKVPMDMIAYRDSKGFVVQNYSSDTELLTLDEALEFLYELEPKGWVLSLKPTHLDNILCIDVESYGYRADNPYMQGSYVYAEISKSGGLHGFLRNPVGNLHVEKPIMKDTSHYDTECFLADHFISFTFKATRLLDIGFVDIVKDYIHPMSVAYKELEYSEYESIQLDDLNDDDSRIAGELVLSEKLPQYDMLCHDLSVEDIRVAMRIISLIIENYPEVESEERIKRIALYLFSIVVPPRDKHNKVITRTLDGEITYLPYTINKAYMFIIESLLYS